MAKLIATDREGNQLVRWWIEGTRIHTTREDLDKDQILQMNQQMRGNLKSVDGMKWALSIPPDDYSALRRLNPDLGAPDAQIRHKAWQKFMVSSLSEPYRVYEAKRGMSA